MSAAVAIVRSDGEGEHLRFWGGGILTMKATAAETDGAFMLFEDHMPEGKTTPLHAHANEDETLYVLDGEILVHIDGQNHRLGPRGIAVAPRGVPHAFPGHLADGSGPMPADTRQRRGVLPRRQRAGRRRHEPCRAR
jgi:quercetin dioxygenase-like cupin family protein